MIIVISVTQADIDAGGHGGGNCPNALAGLRALPQFPHQHFSSVSWRPYGSTVFGTRANRDVEIPLPEEAAGWIRLYDACLDDMDRCGGSRADIALVEYELDVPDGLLAAAAGAS